MTNFYQNHRFALIPLLFLFAAGPMLNEISTARKVVRSLMRADTPDKDRVAGRYPINASMDEGELFHFIHTNGNTSLPNFAARRAIESVFFHHPQARVKIHVPVEHPISNQIFSSLLEKGYRISVEPFNLTSLVGDFSKDPSIHPIAQAAAQNWKIKQGRHWAVDVSDLARLLIVYRQGGVYLDLDLILVKPMPFQNVVCRNRPGAPHATNNFLAFEPNNDFVRALLAHFFYQNKSNSDQYGINGPQSVTKVLYENFTDCWDHKNYTTRIDPDRIKPANSNNGNATTTNTTVLPCPVQVLPLRTYQPLGFSKVAKHVLYDKNQTNKLRQKILENSYGVHFFKDWKKGEPLEEGTLFHWLATSFCVTCDREPQSSITDSANETSAGSLAR